MAQTRAIWIALSEAKDEFGPESFKFARANRPWIREIRDAETKT